MGDNQPLDWRMFQSLAPKTRAYQSFHDYLNDPDRRLGMSQAQWEANKALMEQETLDTTRAAYFEYYSSFRMVWQAYRVMDKMSFPSPRSLHYDFEMMQQPVAITHVEVYGLKEPPGRTSLGWPNYKVADMENHLMTIHLILDEWPGLV